MKTGMAAFSSLVPKSAISLALTVIFATLLAAEIKSAHGQNEDSGPQIFVHYMPWYSADAKAEQWGWHWTMNHFDPSKIDDRGRREIASHDYPLIGPYDSGDADVLEYHVLLMKIAGIDGVIFDWYGTRDFRDYGMIDRNTKAFIALLEKAKLDFTFCYEDQSIKHLIAEKQLDPEDDVREFNAEFRKLHANYFQKDNFLRIDGKPAVLVFGPQHFDPESWTKAIRSTGQEIFVAGLPHLAKKFQLDGAFAWPPVVGGKKISATKWKRQLLETYANYESKNLIPVAFPKFHDIYAEAKLHDSYGFIDDRNGKTFEESLKMARKTQSKLIQIATWNDYGEGTQIEPGQESGFRYLRHLIHTSHDSAANVDDLRLPLELYKRRKSGDESADAISQALFAGNLELARQRLHLKKD